MLRQIDPEVTVALLGHLVLPPTVEMTITRDKGLFTMALPTNLDSAQLYVRTATEAELTGLRTVSLKTYSPFGRMNVIVKQPSKDPPPDLNLAHTDWVAPYYTMDLARICASFGSVTSLTIGDGNQILERPASCMILLRAFPFLDSLSIIAEHEYNEVDAVLESLDPVSNRPREGEGCLCPLLSMLSLQ